MQILSKTTQHGCISMAFEVCDHFGFGTATTFPIDVYYYNPDMQKAFGGDGRYRKTCLLVYCSRCGQLIEVNRREATLIERFLWRVSGARDRPDWRSLPFKGGVK